MDKNGEYKLKKIIGRINNQFKIMWKGYPNIKNILKLLENIIKYKS